MLKSSVLLWNAVTGHSGQWLLSWLLSAQPEGIARKHALTQSVRLAEN